MSGNSNPLSVVVTTSSPGFAWVCLRRAGIDTSRTAIVTTPGASIGTLDDSLGRALAAMVGLTGVTQVVVLGHEEDPVYRVGAEGLSDRARKRGVDPTRGGWGDTIPFPRLAKNADRTIARAVQTLAGASWMPRGLSMVGIVISKDGSPETVALEVSAPPAGGGGTRASSPAEVELEPAQPVPAEGGMAGLDVDWSGGTFGPDPAGRHPAAGGTEPLAGEVSPALADDALAGAGGPVDPGGPMEGGGPLANGGPMDGRGPLGGGGPVATGPTGGGGPLSYGSAGRGGLLGGATSGGPLSSGSSTPGSASVGGGMDVGGPVTSGALGSSAHPDGAGGASSLGLSDGPRTDLGANLSGSGLEALPVTAMESLTSTPVEEGVAPSGSGDLFDGPDLSERWKAQDSATADRQASRVAAREEPEPTGTAARSSRVSGRAQPPDESSLEARLERATQILKVFVQGRCEHHPLRRNMKHLLRTGASPETVMRNLINLVREQGQDLSQVRAAFGTLEMAQSLVDRRTLQALLRRIIL